MPSNLSIKAAFIALFFVQGRRANIMLLALLIVLFMVPYWERGALTGWISHHWGY